MVKKTVLAYYFDEDEKSNIQKLIPDCEVTDAFLFGDIEENSMKELELDGILIDVLGEIITETPGIHMRKGIIAKGDKTYDELFENTGPRFDLKKSNYYLIQLKGPLLETWKKKLKDQKIQLLEHFPGNSFTAKLNPSQFKIAEKLPFVISVRLYNKIDSATILTPSEITAKGSDEMIPMGPQEPTLRTYDLKLHNKEDLDGVLNWLTQKNIKIKGHSQNKIRIELLDDSSFLDDINELAEISTMEEYIKPKLYNDLARITIGVNNENGIQLVGFEGEGQIVGVADTGIDDSHPDFQNRIIEKISYGRPNDTTDPNGHGTHVAGSILGNGFSSEGKIKGVAPKARLIFQSLLDAEGGIGGLPVDYGDLFEDAYQKGVRIHNNSWGADKKSVYNLGSLEVDNFMSKRRDMLIIISAGNDGTAVNVRNSKEGHVDWISIGAPGSSKNALTVGASRSSRKLWGFSQLTWSDFSENKFPTPPISDENVSGDSESIAAFSSRGPCDETRIKPDIVAPGTDIVSTKSSRAPLTNFWSSYPGNDKYAIMGGTSMAAPLVAGCAALVREYYIKKRNHQPSAALLKATLINSTKWLQGDDATADHDKLPNYHQGFGMVYMPYAIPNESGNFDLEFLDTWKESSKHFNATGSRQRYKFTVKWPSPLRLCLVWTDLPGNGLQNNLNVILKNVTTKEKWIGNKDLPRSIHKFDRSNNVKVIRINNPTPGEYIIQINADNIFRDGQDYALALTGNLSKELEPT